MPPSASLRTSASTEVLKLASTLWHCLRRATVWAAVLPACMSSYWGVAQAQEPLPAPRPQASQEERASSRRQPPGPALTLASLEAIALRYNPTLAQATAAIDQERGVWQQSGLYPNPQLGYLRSDSNDPTNRNNAFFLSQEIVTAKKLQLGQAFEAQEIGRARWDRQSQRYRVINDLHIHYYEILGAQQAVTIASNLLQLAEDGLAAAERLYKAKGASYPDVLQARIQRNNARITLQDANYRYDAAWRQLTTIVGRPDLARARIEGRLEPDASEIRWEDALNDLFANSPQLRSAEMRIASARRELAREQAQRIPNLTVQTVTEFDRATDSTTVNTLLAAPVPIFNRNQGNIYNATAAIREASAEVQRVRLVLRDQMADTFRRYAAARFQVTQLHDEIVPDAKENLDIVANGQAQGVFNLFQLLVARQLYSQAELAYVESLTDLHKVRVELTGLLLTGGLNPATLGAAIQTQGGGVSRQQALLNQLREGNTRQILPPALQSLTP
jgi:outer membrane protein, heavy metal efflux system